jgi:type I restriction enzyme, S subunit
MRWPSVKIDSIKASTRYSLVGGPFGSNLTTRDYVDEGVPVIRGTNLPSDIEFHDDDFVFVAEEKADTLSSNMAYPGDLIFTQRGTLGQVGIIPVSARFRRYVVSQSQMKLTVDPELVDLRFVYYFFRHPNTVQEILNRSITSGVPHINLGILKSFDIPFPSRQIQNKIVKILSGYDDLIENNRRRMTLLEQSARLLYEEWFVRLRFPGHEHTRIVDGVPEGWSQKTLESVCTRGDGIQTGPFGSQLHQSDYSDEGVPVVMPKDIIDLRVSTASIARIPEELADSLGRHRMAVGDTVYGRRGDIGRRAYISKRQAGWFCGTGCLRLRPNTVEINPRYLFDTLGTPETVGIITNRAKGSTMLNLSAAALKPVPVLVPSRRLQDIYVEQVERIQELIEVLDEQSQKLRAARDLLLPRLMSGELVA